MLSIGFLNCGSRELVIYLLRSNVVVSLPQLSLSRFKENLSIPTSSTHSGFQEAYNTDQRRPLEDATRLASLLPY
jgi:hypothetical protein